MAFDKLSASLEISGEAASSSGFSVLSTSESLVSPGGPSSSLLLTLTLTLMFFTFLGKLVDKDSSPLRHV